MCVCVCVRECVSVWVLVCSFAEYLHYRAEDFFFCYLHVLLIHTNPPAHTTPNPRPHICTYAYTRPHARSYTHTHRHRHTRVRRHPNMYTHTQTHTRTDTDTQTPTSTGSTGAPGFPGRASRHWQVFRQVCTATSANRTNLDNAVGLLGRT